MYEKELMEIQKRISETVKDSSQDPDGAAAKLEELQKEAEQLVSADSPEHYSTRAMFAAAKGDVYVGAKRPADAEKAYAEMMKASEQLYQLDKEKYDYQLGFSNYKFASFYRMFLQCTEFKAEPKVLNEQQQRLFSVTERLYKNAVACTMPNARKGMPRHVELHALCMSEMMVAYAAVGNYASAAACGKDCVNLDKAIYEKKDDKVHSFRLANHMNTLAAIYTIMKNTELTMEMMEDSIFVLEEHVEEDPVSFGYMLARNYLTLAGCYTQIEDEKQNADDAFKKGLQYMEDVNQKTDNRLVDELINNYMMVGDYYRKTNREINAKTYDVWAMKLASDRFKETKDMKYDRIMKTLKPLV